MTIDQMTNSERPLTNPDASLTNPDAPLTNSDAPLTNPDAPLTNPHAPVVAWWQELVPLCAREPAAVRSPQLLALVAALSPALPATGDCH